jgi:hypothetical protein
MQKIFSFLHRGPYWLRGLKYGIMLCPLFFLSYYPLLFVGTIVPPLWWLFAVWLTITIGSLAVMEEIFGLTLVTSSTGGFFSLPVPNPLGWLILFVIFAALGTVIGSIIGAVKKGTI